MTNIIFWIAILITNVVNAQVWKDEPKSFWYKLSWFFIGWSSLSLLYAISDLIVANV